MAAQTIYMMNGRGPDPAILKGLSEAGCNVHDTHSVGETLNSLRSSGPTLLVAEVQAGAIPLLTLLRETGLRQPPTLLFDQDGSSIQSVIKALQLGVQEYVLASEPPIQRELRTRVLAERVITVTGPHSNTKASAIPIIAPAAAVPADVPTNIAPINFQWDAESYVIYVEDKYVRLSPVEGRIFGMLVEHHNRTVSMEELIGVGLRKHDGSADDGIKLLRPHMMRLRNKLERHPKLAHRVVNVRGNGYMFI
jgi:DNA-binding response OmpR family regulator